MTTLTFRSPVTKPLLAFGTPKPSGDRSTFRVTSPFGWRTDPLDPNGQRQVFHGGLDMGDFGLGSDVVAAADGVIEAIGFLKAPWSLATTRWPSGNYGGWMAVVRHAPTVVSINAHMIPHSSMWVRGSRVTAGIRLGRVGDSGSAAGQAHLHFGIQLNGKDIDPWPLINGAPLVIEDSDVNLPSGLKHVTQGIVGVGNRLRRDPDTATGSRVISQEEGAQFVQVYGLGATGEAWNLGGKAGNTYAWVGWAGETWFVAEPLVTNLQLTATGKAVIPLPTTDCTPFIAAAVDSLNERIRRGKEAAVQIGAAAKALETVLG